MVHIVSPSILCFFLVYYTRYSVRQQYSSSTSILHDDVSYYYILDHSLYLFVHPPSRCCGQKRKATAAFTVYFGTQDFNIIVVKSMMQQHQQMRGRRFSRGLKRAAPMRHAPCMHQSACLVQVSREESTLSSSSIRPACVFCFVLFVGDT